MASKFLKPLLLTLLASPILCTDIPGYEAVAASKNTDAVSLSVPGMTDWSLVGLNKPKVIRYKLKGDGGKLHADVGVDNAQGVVSSGSLGNGEAEEVQGKPGKFTVKKGTASTTHHVSDLLGEFAKEYAKSGVKHFVLFDIIEENTAEGLKEISVGLYKQGTEQFNAIQKTTFGKSIITHGKFNSGPVKSVYVGNPLTNPFLIFNYVDIASPAASAAGSPAASHHEAGGSGAAGAQEEGTHGKGCKGCVIQREFTA